MSASKSIALLALIAAPALLSGCSFWNTVDRSRFEDGGMDSGVDSGDTGLDGDADAGDSDAGDACVPRNEECEGRVDEDCDFLIDCADPDCASLMECCEGGVASTPAWDNTELTFWSQLPTGAMNYPERDMGVLTNFPPGVQGIMQRACVPLAAGYRFDVTLEKEDDSCAVDRCYAALVLTPAPGVMAGARLPEDLGVEMDALGRVAVTNADRLLNPETAESVLATTGQGLKISISVTVGTDVGERAALLATVTTENQSTLISTVLVEAEPFAPLRSLLTISGCDEVPGLRLAVEGAGEFTVGRLTQAPLECTNASRFEPPRRDDELLTAEGQGSTVDLGWGEWGSRGIGSPGFGVEVLDTTTNRWHVVGDGTNFDRNLEGPVELGFGIGYSKTTAGGWGADSDWISHSATAPKVGPCHPSCIGGAPTDCTLMCPAEGPPSDSVRDPSFGVMPLSGDDAVVSYARRRSPDEYSISFETAFRIVNTSREPANDPEITIDMVGDGTCISLRDPVLVPLDPTDPMSKQWLFYSCYTAEDQAEIHAVRLTSALTIDPGATHQRVVRRNIGSWAGSSVWSPEIVVDYEPAADGSMGRHLFRLWFLARNSTRDRVSIGLLQGQLNADQIAQEALPNFVPFGANPVLSEGRDTFTDCPNCLIQGLAVVRVPNSDRIRFLIALQDNAGVPEDWHYAPFEQFWKYPWSEE